jgi:hypothetical protein
MLKGCFFSSKHGFELVFYKANGLTSPARFPYSDPQVNRLQVRCQSHFLLRSRQCLHTLTLMLLLFRSNVSYT